MTTPTQQTPSASSLPGLNVLLMGPAGTGKTTALATAVEAGLEVFYLGLEPGLESLLGYWTDRGLAVPPNLYWRILQPPTASITEMLATAKLINQLSFDALTKMQDSSRSKYDSFTKLLEALNNFTDERTGKSFGAVDSWGTNRMLALDSLTGLNRYAMSMVVGGKPVRSQSDWGLAQDQVEKMIYLLTTVCRCHFTLIAHVERETDMVLGGSKITISTLGQKLAPKLPPMFSDVILCARNGTSFVWDTSNTQADVKTRSLPVKADNPPSFGPVLAKWKARGGAA